MTKEVIDEILVNAGNRLMKSLGYKTTDEIIAEVVGKIEKEIKEIEREEKECQRGKKLQDFARKCMALI